MSGTGKTKEYTVEDYLESLFRAIRRVEECYIHDEYEVFKKKFACVERTFAYEVYHQWRDVLIKSGFENVRIDAEIPKWFKDGKYFPDMVLHGGQGKFNNNFIACEFKRTKDLGEEQIVGDLEKLQRYVGSKSKVSKSAAWTPFHYGVFILIFHNTEGKCVQEELCNRLLSLSEDIRKNIANQDKIICCISDGTALYYEHLDKIMEKKQVDNICRCYNFTEMLGLRE